MDPFSEKAVEQQVATHRGRYLAVLKAALLDQHYLDNEVRIDYLANRPAGAEPDAAMLRDPARSMWVRYNHLAEARATGRSTDERRHDWYGPYSDMGRAALDHLEAAIVDLDERGVAGDVVECGVGRGGGSILLRACLDAYDIADRTIWLVDPFLASDIAPSDDGNGRTRLRSDLNQVRDGFDRFDLLDDRVRFVQGSYAEALADHPIGSIALLRLGLDAAYDLPTVLGRLLPRMAPGGTVILEGFGRPVIERRLASFSERTGLGGHLERVDWNTISWRVAEPTGPTLAGEDPTGGVPATLHRVPLAPARTDDGVDLTVVVVFYDMVRESARTLRSLSRSYQQGIGDLTYEVIAIDNGSPADRRITASEVESYGPEFRLVTIEDAPSSPTVALNVGITQARGTNVALMIDGAHVLTPGVFHHALGAIATYPPAVVAVQQWYVGPGQQGDAQQAGYDQVAEDQLFRRIRWPTDGYRLFEIGHFIGDRDWFDGIIESNCLFVPRALLEQVGGFDDTFSMAGGGYANLELYERLHGHPGVTAASVLGEGTFHQFHGGTTTNVADEAVRRSRVFSYGEHFRETRGRGLMGLSKPVHYVGTMDTKAARRTRSRREFQLAFDAKDRDPVTTTDRTPLAVPEELKFAAIEALWQNQSWREATWLGHRVARYPTDLHSAQELLVQVAPQVVVIVGEDDAIGGRALFVASVLDQLGAGRVIVVGGPEDATRPAHDRITYLDGPGDGPEVIDRVTEAAAGDDVLAFISLGPVQRVQAAFEAYAPLVPVGSYVVVENTVVNGRPVEPGFGPGPHEAVSALLQLHRDFVPDVAFERYTVTFNKNGYLRRTAPA